MNERYAAALHDINSNFPAFHTIGARAYRPGLEDTLMLAEMFSNPHKRFRSIHIAGTNGKGTTAHTIAAALKAAGYCTGLYTSPHLVDFRERIRIDGEMIEEDDVADFMERYHSLNADRRLWPSFFELTTIMAFDCFARHNVDVSVVETGLGGRLDSTNILSPDMCVITNISLDHTQLLGNTPADIAREKAGIIKSGTPVVVGEAEGEVRNVFEHRASEMNAPLFFAQDCEDIITCGGENGTAIAVKASPFGAFDTALHGTYQRSNAGTILCTLQHMRLSGHYHIGNDDAKKAFLKVADTLHGRWERHNGVICDSGHNIAAWRHTARYLAAHAGGIVAVIGFCSDKDVDAILAILPAGVTYHCVAAPTPRAIDAATLAGMMRSHGLDAYSFDSVQEGVEAARAKKTAEVFLGGSFFVVAEFVK